IDQSVKLLGCHARGVAVRVQVDETRRDDQAFAINDLDIGSRFDIADRKNSVAANVQVRLASGLVASVVKRGLLNDYINLNRFIRREEHGQQHRQTEGHNFTTSIKS